MVITSQVATDHSATRDPWQHNYRVSTCKDKTVYNVYMYVHVHVHDKGKAKIFTQDSFQRNNTALGEGRTYDTPSSRRALYQPSPTELRAAQLGESESSYTKQGN